MSKNTLIIVVAIGAVAIGFLLAFFLLPRTEVVEVGVEPEPLKYVLPADVVEITPCIPQHGAHQGKIKDHDPEADMNGPTYILDEVCEVIGIEYHVRMDYLERMGEEAAEQIRKLGAKEITYAELKVADLVAGFDLLGRPVQYANLDYKPLGHPGFGTPHIDVHAYTISKEEVLTVCLP